MEITKSITIEQGSEEVWNAIANVGQMDQYHPLLETSKIVSENSNGAGTQFKCEFGANRHIIEEVKESISRQRLRFANIASQKMPKFKRSETTFELEPLADKTRVSMSVLFELGGLFGPVMEKLFVRGQYEKLLPQILGGLKQYCESK